LSSQTENKVLWEQQLPTGQTLRVIQGDITLEQVEAIVNAANEHLMHGGGVAGAIRRQGGAVIQQESSAWVRTRGRVTTGSAAITSGGNLPAKYVIHAVGPVWGSGHEEIKLSGAVQSALNLAESHQIHSLSIPGISSGIFGGPKDVCARVIIETVMQYLQANPATCLQAIHFCNIDFTATATFLDEIKRQVK